jgi:hypothetical protein
LVIIYQELGVLGKGQKIRGSFERQGEAMARNLEVLAKRGVEGAKELARAVKQAAAAGNGQVVMYSGQGAKQHETFHWSSEQAKLDLNERHANLDKLTTGATWMRMSRALQRIGYVPHRGTLVEEAAAHLAEGEYRRLGLTRDEAISWMKDWFDSFIEKNGKPSPKQFQEMSDEATEAREAIYAAREAAQVEQPDADVPSLSEGRGAGAGAHLARGPTEPSLARSEDPWERLADLADELEARGKQAEQRKETTSARKLHLAEDRAALDLPELPEAERKAWQTTLDNAEAANIPARASALAEEVLNKPRAFDDEETAGIVLRMQQVKNEHKDLLKEVDATNDLDELAKLQNQLRTREDEFDKLSRATKISGTEKGRALASQKLTINRDYELITVLSRAKAALGRELDEDERKWYKAEVDRLEQLNKDLTDEVEKQKDRDIVREQSAIKRMQSDIKSTAKRKKKAKSLDEEAVVIEAQIAAAWAKAQAAIHPSGLASIDPEGEISALIAKLARNRVEKGLIEALPLAKDLFERVKAMGLPVTERDIRDAYSGYGQEAKRPRTEIQKEIDRIKNILQRVSEKEDVEAGILSARGEGPRQSEARSSGIPLQGPHLSDVRRVPAEGPKLGDINRVPLRGPRMSEASRSGVPLQGPKLSDIRKVPEQGPTLSEGTGRKQGPRFEDAPLQGPRESDARRLPMEGPKITDAPKVGPNLSDVRRVPAEGPKLSEANKLPAAGPAGQHRYRARLEKRLADLEDQLLHDSIRVNSPKAKVVPDEQTFRVMRQIDAATRAIEQRLAHDAMTQPELLARQIGNLLGLYRAIETSWDLSFGLRQGKMGLASHPVMWGRSFVKQFQGLSNEKYDRAVYDIENDPDFRYMERFGLNLPTVQGRGSLAGKAEEFQTEFSEKIPGIRQSEQTYNLAGDTLRTLWFKHNLNMLRKAGFSPDDPKDFDAFTAAAEQINDFTGRTNLDRLVPGKMGQGLNQATPIINMVTYAARFWASRLKILSLPFDPRVYPQIPGSKKLYESLPRPVRMEGWRTLLAFYGLIGAQLVLANLLLRQMGIGAVEWKDPDNPDWGKIRVGNRHFDVSAGLLTHLRVTARIAKRIYEAKRGIPAQPGSSPSDILGTYLRTKESPPVRKVHDTFLSKRTKEGYGTDFKGDPVYPFGKPGAGFFGRPLSSNLVPQPLGLQDAIQAYQQMGWWGVATTAPFTFFGESVNVYPPKGQSAIKNPQVADMLKKLGIADKSLVGQSTKHENLDKSIETKVMEQVESLAVPQGATDTGQEKIVRDKLEQMRKLAKAQAAIENPTEYGQYLRSQDAELDFLTDAEKARLTPADVVKYRSFYADTYLSTLGIVTAKPEYKAMDADKKEKVLDGIGRRSSIVARQKMIHEVRPK